MSGIAVLAGLLLSFMVRRRRVFVRASAAGVGRHHRRSRRADPVRRGGRVRGRVLRPGRRDQRPASGPHRRQPIDRCRPRGPRSDRPRSTRSHRLPGTRSHRREAPDRTAREAPDRTVPEAADRTDAPAPDRTVPEAADRTDAPAPDRTDPEAADRTDARHPIRPTPRNPIRPTPTIRRGVRLTVPVNTGLADVSNDLLLTAVVIYALAMLAYACDFAFGRKQVPACEPPRCPRWSAPGRRPTRPLVGAARGERRRRPPAGGAVAAARRGGSGRRLAVRRCRWLRPATRLGEGVLDRTAWDGG